MLHYPKSIKKVILASIIGNIVELFDFTLFAILVRIFAKKFFPGDGNFVALSISLAVFAVAFFARPVGAILFGIIGDKYGRKKTIILSISLMSTSTFCIGTIPTYDTIGIMAPILLVLCRLLQGLSIGGEFASSSIFLIEYLSSKRGLASGITLSSAVLGALIATYIGHLVIELSPLFDYAWRIPFLVGGMLAFLGVYLRLAIDETPEYKELMSQAKSYRFSLKEVFTHYFFEFILVVGLCAYAGVILYCFNIYIFTFNNFFEN